MRMYKGKMTLFYNGEVLLVDDTLIYNWEERQTWEVIMVLPGVEVILESTFLECENVKTVIMADTVRRIEHHAFENCYSLEYVQLSRNLEYIGAEAFYWCRSLTSIFIPPSCTEIDGYVFRYCEKLIILSVPQHTHLRNANVIVFTALMKASPFTVRPTCADYEILDEVYQWIKNQNADNQFSLHRACSSYFPTNEVVFDIIKKQGLRALREPNSIGITPLQYLEVNPYVDIDVQEIVKKYILEMMGEVVE